MDSEVITLMYSPAMPLSTFELLKSLFISEPAYNPEPIMFTTYSEERDPIKTTPIEEPQKSSDEEIYIITGSQEVMENEEKFRYLIHLEKHHEWENVVDKKHVKAWINRQGTKLNQSVPIIYAKIDFKTTVEPKNIEKLINDPEIRQKWDKESLVKFVDFRGYGSDVVYYYKQNKAPWPFKNRDFVERRLINFLPNGDVHTCFEAIEAFEYPVSSEAERGETVLGGMFIRKKGSNEVEITMVNQVDLKGNIPSKFFTSVLPNGMVSYRKALQKAIRTIYRPEVVELGVDDMFQYLTQLDTNPGWVLKAQKDDIEVFLLDETKVISDPEIRLAWDKDSLLDLRVFDKTGEYEKYYQLTKAPQPMKNRDFVEKRYIQTAENGDMTVYFHSTEDDQYPPVPTAERAETLLGGLLIRRINMQAISISLIRQVDLKGDIQASMYSTQLPRSAIAWKGRLQEALQDIDILSRLTDETEDVNVVVEDDLVPIAMASNSHFSKESPEVSDNFDYVFQIEQSDQWQLKVDKPEVKVYMMPGSKFDEKIPVIRTCFDLETDLTSSELISIINDPEKRLKWDKDATLEFINITNTPDCVDYYSLSKAPWPLKNRDWVERRYTRHLPDGDLYTFYSHVESGDHPPRENCERAMTLFGGQLLRKKQNGFAVTLLAQSDLRGNIPANVFNNMIPATAVKWRIKFIKAIESYKNGEL